MYVQYNLIFSIFTIIYLPFHSFPCIISSSNRYFTFSLNKNRVMYSKHAQCTLIFYNVHEHCILYMEIVHFAWTLCTIHCTVYMDIVKFTRSLYTIQVHCKCSLYIPKDILHCTYMNIKRNF